MNKLIISTRSYDWINYTVGTILLDPSFFSVMIILKDDDRSMCDCRNFCKQSIYEQRKFDMFNVGKKLGIKKLMNLSYNADSIDIGQLTAQLQLYIMLSNIKEVYCQYNDTLAIILNNIKDKINMKVYFYNIEDNYKYTMIIGKEFILDETKYSIKKEIEKLIVGYNTTNELVLGKQVEKFYINHKRNDV